MFYGLPGLIVEIYDNENYYHFTINGLETVEKPDKIYMTTKNVVKSSRENFRKTMENQGKNPEAKTTDK